MVEGDAKPLRAELKDDMGHRREPFLGEVEGLEGGKRERAGRRGKME